MTQSLSLSLCLSLCFYLSVRLSVSGLLIKHCTGNGDYRGTILPHPSSSYLYSILSFILLPSSLPPVLRIRPLTTSSFLSFSYTLSSSSFSSLSTFSSSLSSFSFLLLIPSVLLLSLLHVLLLLLLVLLLIVLLLLVLPSLSSSSLSFFRSFLSFRSSSLLPFLFLRRFLRSGPVSFPSRPNIRRSCRLLVNKSGPSATPQPFQLSEKKSPNPK